MMYVQCPVVLDKTNNCGKRVEKSDGISLICHLVLYNLYTSNRTIQAGYEPLMRYLLKMRK